ncbi:MAG: serine protease [Gammaproteobacteria bacterium]|nr:serine protease [Gammaproteobacteria bacterium]
MQARRPFNGLTSRLLYWTCAVAIASASAAPSSGGRSTLQGSTPSWATTRNLSGAADPATVVGFRVYLGWIDPNGAAALAKSVSDPHSSSYGHYLTPNQFRSRFAPSAADTAKVQNWLKSQGFDLTYTPQNNHYISVEGTLAQAQAAFGVQFGIYSVHGQSLRSPVNDLSIPSSLATTVKAVVGLDQSYQFVQTYHRLDTNAPPAAGFRNAPPLSTFWAQVLSPYAFPAGFTSGSLPSVPWTVKGYTPDQIKAAYGISGYDGAGQTVAIIDAYASPTILQDVNQWSVNRGLPTMNPSQLVQVVPPGIYKRPENPQQDPQGWYGEETLDVEAVHGMAPAAKIVYVGAPNNRQDLDAAMNHVVDQRLAQIVTNSYGFGTTELLPPGYVKPMEDTLIQAAIEGIGVYFSSGDNGDESSSFGFATTDWPASSPWVTAVGGTSLGIDSSNQRAVETGWGTSNYNCNSTTLACTRTGWLYGAGGGVSVVFAEPWYQQMAGLTLSGRGLPDVAALADPQTGLLVGQTQAFPNGNYYDEYRIGGTSLASPIFAGIMAVADQKAGHPHGFANPLIYDNPAAFYDILPVKTAVARRNYNNGVDASSGTADRLRTFDDYSGSPSQHTNQGWDNVTGLGTPNASFLSLIGH